MHQLFVFAAILALYGGGLAAQAKRLVEMSKELRSANIDRQDFITAVNFPVVRDFDELLDASEVVVIASVGDFRFRLAQDGTSIETIYKLSVENTLKGDRLRPASGPPRRDKETVVPGTLDPRTPTSREILILREGGLMTINGVRFHEHASYPDFQAGERYLLFLSPIKPSGTGNYYGDENVSYFTPLGGPTGCFAVVEGDQRSVRALKGSSLEAHLSERFSSNIHSLLSFLNQRIGR